MNSPLHPTPDTPRPDRGTLSLIYARSENHVIGNAGAIPWRLPDDFAHFKATTMRRPIIMGRKTYEDHCSALPGRLNIVVTRQTNYQAADGIEVVGSLDAAIARGYEENDGIFIIGGVGLFQAAFDQADRVYETIVHAQVEGETVLPAFDFAGWQTTILLEHPADDRHAHAFTVLEHKRVAR